MRKVLAQLRQQLEKSTKGRSLSLQAISKLRQELAPAAGHRNAEGACYEHLPFCVEFIFGLIEMIRPAKKIMRFCNPSFHMKHFLNIVFCFFDLQDICII
ncbi:hypothetical protein CD33_11625 [Ureibacillus sinduriensis BLB-1 = JCM 15800]|uniref:Uncharacterized protein n=1 Tax=Ureibacillus sinduriensis BLB-1 = JCM 15800 TaxID=1384057 RepID=A0A0A3HYD6_9BACL|nr:hypothetical protein CD33_11625 [Ureibacillus sinduriensis BLB-1 = JCM 15800]